MITFDKDRIYTWGRLQKYFKWSEEYVYHLHAKDYDYQDRWSVMLPILVRAMVASDDRLFVLGPQELMRQDVIKDHITEDKVQKLMVEQEKALNGNSGSTLLVVDKRTGKMLSGCRLPVAPLLDGMLAPMATCISRPPTARSAVWATKGRPWLRCRARRSTN